MGRFAMVYGKISREQRAVVSEAKIKVEGEDVAMTFDPPVTHYEAMMVLQRKLEQQAMIDRKFD